MDPQQMLQAATAPLLGVFGIVLQFARAYRAFREWRYYVAAFLLSAAGYFLTADFIKHLHGPFGVQLTIVLAVLGIAGNMAAVMGGTFGASNAAKAGAAFVPMTNSK